MSYCYDNLSTNTDWVGANLLAYALEYGKQYISNNTDMLLSGVALMLSSYTPPSFPLLFIGTINSSFHSSIYFSPFHILLIFHSNLLTPLLYLYNFRTFSDFFVRIGTLFWNTHKVYIFSQNLSYMLIMNYPKISPFFL